MIDEQLDGSDRSDRWLPMILGLLSVATRLDRSFAIDTIERPTRSPSDEPALALLYGLAKLSQALQSRLDGVGASPVASPGRREAQAVEGLLR